MSNDGSAVPWSGQQSDPDAFVTLATTPVPDFYGELVAQLNPEGVRCAWCGEVARGSAWINAVRYCHDERQPSCYSQALTSR